MVKIEPITPMHSYELRTESTTDAPGAVLKCTGRHRIVVPVESDGEFGVEQAVRLSRGQRVYCSGFVERILVDSVVYSVEGPSIPVFQYPSILRQEPSIPVSLQTLEVRSLSY